MPRAVLDSTVLVSGVITPKCVAAEILDRAVRGAFDLYLSEALIEETRGVLLERKHLRKRFRYSDQEVEEFCLLLRIFARTFAELPSVRVSRDPADDMVVASALKAKAQYLVTRDKDLLSISHEGIRILGPEDSMALLRKG